MLTKLDKLIRGRMWRRRPHSCAALSRRRFLDKFEDILASERAKKEGSAALVRFTIENYQDYPETLLRNAIGKHLRATDLFGDLGRGRYLVGISGVTNEGAATLFRKIAKGILGSPIKKGELAIGVKHASAPIPENVKEFLDETERDSRPFEEPGGPRQVIFAFLLLINALALLIGKIKSVLGSLGFPNKHSG